jgi:hypothetical protein
MLRENKTLSTLDYGDNDIGTEGHQELYRAWCETRAATSQQIVVQGGKFEIRPKDFQEASGDSLRNNGIQPSANQTGSSSQYQWAKQQILSLQAKRKVRGWT